MLSIAGRREGHCGDGHRKQVRDAEVREKGDVDGQEGQQEVVDGVVGHLGHLGAPVGC